MSHLPGSGVELAARWQRPAAYEVRLNLADCLLLGGGLSKLAQTQHLPTRGQGPSNCYTASFAISLLDAEQKNALATPRKRAWH